MRWRFIHERRPKMNRIGTPLVAVVACLVGAQTAHAKPVMPKQEARAEIKLFAMNVCLADLECYRVGVPDTRRCAKARTTMTCRVKYISYDHTCYQNVKATGTPRLVNGGDLGMYKDPNVFVPGAADRFSELLDDIETVTWRYRIRSTNTWCV